MFWTVFFAVFLSCLVAGGIFSIIEIPSKVWSESASRNGSLVATILVIAALEVVAIFWTAGAIYRLIQVVGVA